MKTKDQITIYQTKDGTTSIEVKLENELTKSATVKESMTVQKEGTRTVKRKLEFTTPY